MRNKFLLTFLILISVTSYAQNGIRLYGYFRESVPGIIARGNAEDGTPIKTRSSVEYFLYLVSPSAAAVVPVEVWIDGNPYSLTTEKVSRTPVLSPKDKTGKSTTLVPRTTLSVRKLKTRDYIPGKVFSRAKAKAAANQLVVVYKMYGRYYSATLKNLVRLEPNSND